MIPMEIAVGDLVVTRVDYRAPDGRVKGKTRPLVIISRPNSKGDLLAIAGSTKLHQWAGEPHIVIQPKTVTGGELDEATVFPATKQILINPTFIKVKIGRIRTTDLELLMRLCAAIRTRDFFEGCHRPGLASPFIPGKTPIHYAGRVFDENEIQAAVEASLDFWLTEGRFAREFETEFAATIGVKHALLVNSGSSANLIAVSALTSPLLGDRRLIPGDEVITVAAGFPTTINPIIQNGLIPVFVDMEIPTYNAKVEEIEAAIGPKTRAIFLAHTLGNPFNIDSVLALCQKHNLWLIEDNCDALGSTYNPKPKTQTTYRLFRSHRNTFLLSGSPHNPR